MAPRTHLSLFTGAGGGEQAAHLLGFQTVCCVEREPYAVEILRRRIADGILDDCPIWDDCSTFDGRPWRDLVDVLSAGFPCTPFSVAGKQRADKDERNGWPHTIRIIGEVAPSYCLLENVPGLLSGKHGYFATVLEGLHRAGYDARWDCLPASAVGAPHQRDRLWIVAARREVAHFLVDPAPDGTKRFAVWAEESGKWVPWSTDIRATQPLKWPRAGAMSMGRVWAMPPLAPVSRGKTNPLLIFPTPAATIYGSSQNGINGKGGENERPSAGRPSRETMARSGRWPTPHGMGDDGHGNELAMAVRVVEGLSESERSRQKVLWPTPNASGGTGYMSGSNRDTWHPTLEGAVRMSPDGPPPVVTAEEFRGKGRGAAMRYPTPNSSMRTVGDMEQARFAGDDPRRPAYGAIPTPCASDWKDSSQPGQRRGQLCEWAEQGAGAQWTGPDGKTHTLRAIPTPTVGDSRSSGRHTTTTMQPGTSLTDFVRKWPTPRAADSYERRNWATVKRIVEEGGDITLTSAVRYDERAKQERFPTPRAEDSQCAGAHRGEPDTLTAYTQRWPTPKSRDWKNATGGEHRDSPDLNVAVHWPTPLASDGSHGPDTARAARPGSGGDDLATAVSRGAKGQLSPDWVEALMGWPAGWTSLDPLDMNEFFDWYDGFANGNPSHYGPEAWRNGLWEKGLPRVGVKIPERVRRLKAIGNGQVPLVAAMAWRLLSPEFKANVEVGNVQVA